eukprot:g759.t1
MRENAISASKENDFEKAFILFSKLTEQYQSGPNFNHLSTSALRYCGYTYEVLKDKKRALEILRYSKWALRMADELGETDTSGNEEGFEIIANVMGVDFHSIIEMKLTPRKIVSKDERVQTNLSKTKEDNAAEDGVVRRKTIQEQQSLHRKRMQERISRVKSMQDPLSGVKKNVDKSTSIERERQSFLPCPVYVISLLTKERSKFFEENRSRFPSLQVFHATNGYNIAETVKTLKELDLLYSDLDKGYNTYGTLANWLSKYRMLEYQVKNAIPFVTFLEDDVLLKPGFSEYLKEAIQELKSKTHNNMVRLLNWGEGYVTSLDGARRILKYLKHNGIIRNIDFQLRLFAGPEIVKPCPYIKLVVNSGAGDSGKTKPISLSDLPKKCITSISYTAEKYRTNVASVSEFECEKLFAFHQKRKNAIMEVLVMNQCSRMYRNAKTLYNLAVAFFDEGKEIAHRLKESSAESLSNRDDSNLALRLVLGRYRAMMNAFVAAESMGYDGKDNKRTSEEKLRSVIAEIKYNVKNETNENEMRRIALFHDESEKHSENALQLYEKITKLYPSGRNFNALAGSALRFSMYNKNVLKNNKCAIQILGYSKWALHKAIEMGEDVHGNEEDIQTAASLLKISFDSLEEKNDLQSCAIDQSPIDAAKKRIRAAAQYRKKMQENVKKTSLDNQKKMKNRLVIVKQRVKSRLANAKKKRGNFSIEDGTNEKKSAVNKRHLSEEEMRENAILASKENDFEKAFILFRNLTEQYQS